MNTDQQLVYAIVMCGGLIGYYHGGLVGAALGILCGFLSVVFFCLDVLDMSPMLLLMSLCICGGLFAVALVVSKKRNTKSPSSSSSPGGSAGDLGTALVGSSGKTTISFYGQSINDDNGQGFIGVDLFKHGNAGITFKGQRVYPVAVHHDHAPQFLYKLMEIEGKGLKKKIIGHVVDICNRQDSPCKNVNEHGLNFLVDIHATAFKDVGMNDGLTTGTYKVVGQLRPPAMPSNIWIKGAETYLMCSCTGKCEGVAQKWVKVGMCK